jgi:alpha-tubulin suppressor-like RCC1 family protein
VVASGDVYCTGHNDEGILGNGSLADSPQDVPSKVVDLASVKSLDVTGHACAALEDGSLACWGDGGFAFGDARNDDYPSAVTVAGVSRVADVAAGYRFVCVLTEDQEIYCWGVNGDYQCGLGEGSPIVVNYPTRVDWRQALP